MGDVFIDCEWIGGDYLTILGAYSYGQDRFQLSGSFLTPMRLSRFLNLCFRRSGTSDTFLYCHGPDIGRIEGFFDIDLKRDYWCVNTITAFKEFTTFRNTSLGHLENYFGLPRKEALTPAEMRKLWNSRSAEKRGIVLDYNWDDCVNLWRLVCILKSEYDVTTGDFKSIAME